MSDALTSAQDDGERSARSRHHGAHPRCAGATAIVDARNNFLYGSLCSVPETTVPKAEAIVLNTPIKRGRGRPTLYTHAAVELAAQGLPLTQVAKRLGVTDRACSKWMSRHAEFREAVERGRALARHQTRQRQQERAEAKRTAKQSARAAALNMALHKAGLIPDMPMPVIAPEPERPPARQPITSTGTRTPDMPRWHERQRAARIASGEDPPPLPARQPAPVKRELPDYCWPRDDDVPYDPLAEWR